MFGIIISRIGDTGAFLSLHYYFKDNLDNFENFEGKERLEGTVSPLMNYVI